MGSAVVQIESRAGLTRASFGVSSCDSCAASADCLARRILSTDGNSYQLLKNIKVISPRDHVFQAGDITDMPYVVRSGSVKSYILTEEGDEQVLNFYHPGDIVGLDGIGVKRYLTSSISLENTTLCKLPFTMLMNQDLGVSFLNKISGYLIHDHNMKLILATKDADGRMASFLLDLSRRFIKHDCKQNQLVLTMTRKDMANYLGLAIETVSRVLSRFQDNGLLVITRRKIDICDIDGLQSIAGTQIR